MMAIMEEYYEKTSASKGVPKLDFDWDFYMGLWLTDSLVLITARENEELIGFSMYIVKFHPQYKTTLFATCNTLAVKLGYRGRGVATKLVKASESYLKMCNVKYMIHGFRAVYDAEPLFKKLGFELSEQFYQKVI
jgi:GNAT superfamily N-acetyltransferase